MSNFNLFVSNKPFLHNQEIAAGLENQAVFEFFCIFVIY